MVSSKAATPEAYLAELPPERRALVVSRLRDLVNANLPDGYVERMSWGMIGWEVPLERYPDTYNGSRSSMPASRRRRTTRALPQLRLRVRGADGAAQGGLGRGGQEARHGQELPPLQTRPSSSSAAGAGRGRAANRCSTSARKAANSRPADA
jgi:hypothetical protein